MSSHPHSEPATRLDMSRWRSVPKWMMLGGGVLALIGALVNSQQFAYSWLLAFMFFLSLCLGGLFLVILHHLFDASWSLPIRRVNEHIAGLLPWMAVLFIPIALLAKKLYPWMRIEDPHSDHALHAKLPLFTMPGFYLVTVICFGVWWLLSNRLRYWSLRQDRMAEPLCTYKMRFFAAWGVFAFALTLSFAAIMWMKALSHEWFSTMYGVYYFAASVWTTIATVYIITWLLQRTGPLRNVIHDRQYYFLGSLLFAFTVFYSYIHFSQYFIIWNANIPEETFWYMVREQGSWAAIGLLIIFGHFFIPFLALIRIDLKLKIWWMLPIGVWAWVMHFADMSFNIMPVLHPEGFHLSWMDLACWAFMGGLLITIFLKNYFAHPPYPLKDPRFAEAMGAYVAPDEYIQAMDEPQTGPQ